MPDHLSGDWGMLINPDKSPTPLFESLCLGIARYISTFDSHCTAHLMPESMALFYRKVGGNYDTLFLETKAPALSFIYQSLGCFHSLQPSENAFEPPSIPALLPSGFMRWQTIQILLDPDEHCRYLQNAVGRWDIVDQNSGSAFSKTIPRDAFPERPDIKMVQWHEDVSRRLEYDYWKRNVHQPPPNTGTRNSHTYSSPNNGNPNEERVREDYCQTSRTSRHQRRKSAEYPPRKVRSAFFQRPPSYRPGFASPRAPSPPPWPNHSRSRGRAHFSVGVESEASDASETDSGIGHHREERYVLRGKHGAREPHIRPRSHDPCARRPSDVSPGYDRQQPHRDSYPWRHSKHYEYDKGPTFTANEYASEFPERRGSKLYEFTFVGPDSVMNKEHTRHCAYPEASTHCFRRPDPGDRRYSYSSSSGSNVERNRPLPAEAHRRARWAKTPQANTSQSRRRVSP